MKILYLIDTLSLGGAQTVLKGIFENQKDNRDIFIYALRKTEITVKIEHNNVIIDNSESKYSISPFFRLKRFISKTKIDILHCQLPRSHVFGYFIKKYFNRKLKLIIHEQGDIFEEFPLHAHFLRKSAGFASLFISCSIATGEKLISKTGIDKNKVSTIYNFVDTEKFSLNKLKEIRSSERHSKNISESNFVFGFAGRLIERKGWREFVLSALQLKNETVKFVIAGAGEQESELKQLISSLGLSDFVFYLGYFDDMLKFYSLIDCLVVPSHWEPMGITEIEAMALKIPVIASDVPGLNEIVINNKTGLLFRKKDSVDLSEKMEIVLKDKNLRFNLIEESANQISNYEYKEFIEKLNLVYSSI